MKKSTKVMLPFLAILTIFGIYGISIIGQPYHDSIIAVNMLIGAGFGGTIASLFLETEQ